MKQVHKERTRIKGMKLVMTRSFRKWYDVLDSDNVDLKASYKVAENHFVRAFGRKMLNAWHDVLRERGKILRIRERTFSAWAKWAPRTRRLRLLEVETARWLLERRTRKAFDAMTTVCFDFLNKRIGALKVLRRSMNDRKLLVCAYALMNHDAKVVMLDCWRRWRFYAGCRARWKAAQWNFRYLWCDTKMRGG
jgi:hypothetical protein